jgi:TonB family protein
MRHGADRFHDMQRAPIILAAAAILGGCSPTDSGKGRAPFQIFNRRPDTPPVMLNKGELPFRYPVELYPQRVQGNVVLRLFVNENGQVVSDSTQVAKTSGHAALDSAAVKGSKQLMFVPAKRRGEPLAVSILVPVYFRHPEAPPMPEDSALKKPTGKK